MRGGYANADSQPIGNERYVDDAPLGVIDTAVLGARHIRICRPAGLRQIDRIGDVADGAAHGTRPVQGTLRAAQHFDALHVEEARLCLPLRVQVAHGHRYIVEIHGHGRRPGSGTDAAQLDILIARTALRREGQVRNRSRQIGELDHVQGLDLRGRDH